MEKKIVYVNKLELLEQQMNDNDIIKALERCNDPILTCEGCPLERAGSCLNVVKKYALDLINRLKAENERLKDYNDNLQSANTALSCTLLDEVKKAKTEVIKELAIRFDEIVTGIYNKHIFGYDLYDGEEEAVMDYAVEITYAFENLVKEMTEGEDA